MVDLSVSHPSHRRGAWRFPRLVGLLGKGMGFVTVVGAAIRVARVVETNGTPRPEDLATLGINGPLPKTW